MTAHIETLARTATEYDLSDAAPLIYSVDYIRENYAGRGGSFTGSLDRIDQVRFFDTGEVIHLNTPLCPTCEGKLDCGCCHDCQTIYTTGWMRAEASHGVAA